MPDIGAAEIALAAVVSHYHKGADPVWLFVLGPSSGDKGSIIMNSILAQENTHLMGDLTPKTFLSGYKGDETASMLHVIGSGILAFKEFGTIISKRSDDLAEIIGQLREIYDGLFSKRTGMTTSQEWHGKITVIAAGTPAIERHWGVLADLGERFLQVRIPKKQGLKQGEYAQRQAGREEFIKQRMQELAKELFRTTRPPITYPPPQPNAQQQHQISALAEIVAHSRGKVPRDPRTDAITGLAEIENNGRACKELSGLVSGHAALFRRTNVDTYADMWVAERVARNTIPMTRWQLLYPISRVPGISTGQLAELSRLPMSTVTRTANDLLSLGMIYLEQHPTVGNCYTLTEEIAEVWSEAFNLVSIPDLGDIGRSGGGC